MRALSRPSHLMASLLVGGSLLVAAMAAAEPAPRAVATEVDGNVRVEPAEGATPHRLRTLERLPAGGVVVVPAGGRLTVLCSTDHLVLVDGPARWEVGEPACRSGKRLPAGTFRGVLPEQGRLVRFGDVLALEMVTRDDEDPGVPILLAPRHTAVVDVGAVVWTEVPGAVQYELRLDLPARGAAHRARIDPAQAACGTASPDWSGVAVCSVPWQAVLAGGERPLGTAYLSVAARLALGAPWRQEERASRLRWLSDDQEGRSTGDAFLDAVRAARSALERGLLEDARRRLIEALALREAAELQVTLGDLYLQIGLPRLAAESYRRAADESSAAGAAATYGLGRANYALRRFAAARTELERAAELFARAGLADEAESAARAAAAAGRHLAH